MISSYTNAAQQTGSILCPAGLAWKYGWQTDASLPLYSFDSFHPAVAGSMLAALVIYATLSSKENFDFTDHRKCTCQEQIRPETFKTLKGAALKAVSK